MTADPRISEADLLKNPNLNLQNVERELLSQRFEEESSALMTQISNLNLSKRVKKVKDPNAPVKPKARF